MQEHLLLGKVELTYCQIFQMFLFEEQIIQRNYLRNAIFQIVLTRNW